MKKVSTIIYWELFDIPEKWQKKEDEINYLFEKALSRWTEWIPIDFKNMKNDNSLDRERIKKWENYLEVRFGSYKHACVEDFDGEGGVLAHGTFSEGGFEKGKRIELTIHFDAEERWNFSDPDNGYNNYIPSEREFSFFSVALHEIGHNLGLDHNKQKTSIMSENYSNITTLSCGDILRVQKILGVRKKYKEKCEISNYTKTDRFVFILELLLVLILILYFRKKNLQ